MNSHEKQAILIADLGYGDAGKGSVVDTLTRLTNAHTVVRYNGGAQAAHNVITPDGRHHTFAQFGSGTFLPYARTYLSRYMMIHPLAMLAEERHLQTLGIYNAFPRMSVEREALVTTPFQQSANRIKELARGEARHGSCGMGVGETMSDWLAYGEDVIFAGDLVDRAVLIKKLRRVRDIKFSQLEFLLIDTTKTDAITQEMSCFHDPHFVEATADIYQRLSQNVRLVGPEFLGEILNRPGTTIFEGAQGVLLDEWFGFYPYNTWSTLTFKNADTLLGENEFSGEILKLGLTRGYATRHGAGPFVTEDKDLYTLVPDHHNESNPWQRQFRVGYLDLVALRYALQVTGRIDGLVVTNLDRMDAFPVWKTCNQYKGSTHLLNLENHFEFLGAHIQDIRVPADPMDLIQQEELTQLLHRVEPIYEIHTKDMDSYLDSISQNLGVPIALSSFGPTAADKKLHGVSLSSAHVSPPLGIK